MPELKNITVPNNKVFVGVKTRKDNKVRDTHAENKNKHFDSKKTPKEDYSIEMLITKVRMLKLRNKYFAKK